ncbi:MAG: hypothetical protein EAZ92_05200 [Candidatus Kapaibacterium sp.]|nr:MAG: hypothetical protein EAZ92_05200 [Candidatus Kapabacteria bacterium]
MKKLSSVRFSTVVFAMVLLVNTVLVACPNCKDNFDLNTTSGGIGSAYGYTIYLLIAMPIVIVVTLALRVKKQMQANDKTEMYRRAA